MTDCSDKNRMEALEGELSILRAMQEPLAYACVTEEGQYTTLCYDRQGAYDDAHRHGMQVVPLAPIGAIPASHPDDEHVDMFANAMKLKLAACRAKGRSGWDDPEQCTTERLEELLIGHLAKGHVIDVANFCMMLHQRGKPIIDSPQSKFHTEGTDA